jgi:hypothetical protein
MEEHLVGYVLNSLDPDTQREVEAYVRTHPEAERQVLLLRRSLEPLAADAPDEPRAGLWVRTLAHIARDQCRKPDADPLHPYRDLPKAPRADRPVSRGSAWWRRADVLVAACLMLLLGGLGATWVAGAWQQHQVRACQNNLRNLYQALASYSDHHDGDFPRVEGQPPRNVAGIFVPILHDAGYLSPNANLTCAAGAAPLAPPPSLEQLQEMQRDRPEDFQALVRGLSGCYAYSLGYLDGGVLFGLRRGDDEHLPIVADRPPFGDGLPLPGNSPNHGGQGQNVLYVGGQVRFCPDRTVGVNRDDIFVNQKGKVAAGQSPYDSVLGVSWARPYPKDE